VLAAFSRASVVLKEPRYLEQARAQWAFVRKQIMLPDQQGVHRIAGDKAAVTAPTDLLMVAAGALAFANASHESAAAKTAGQLLQAATSAFLDEHTGRFFAAASSTGSGFWRRPYLSEPAGGEGPLPESLALELSTLVPTAKVSAALRSALVATLDDPGGPPRGDILLALSAAQSPSH
jgi:uncharacterized protein YyaL (SSP411 family)